VLLMRLNCQPSIIMKCILYSNKLTWKKVGSHVTKVELQRNCRVVVLSTKWICVYAVVYTYININETKRLRWNIRSRNVKNQKHSKKNWDSKQWMTHGSKAAYFLRALSVSTICFAEHMLKTVWGICLIVWISLLWVVATRLLSCCPPQQRVWEGGPKRNGWWKKRFFLTLPYLTLDM
jgi:hypothetical protein